MPHNRTDSPKLVWVQRKERIENVTNYFVWTRAYIYCTQTHARAAVSFFSILFSFRLLWNAIVCYYNLYTSISIANRTVLFGTHGVCHIRTTLLFEALVHTAQLWLVCLYGDYATVYNTILFYCCCGRNKKPCHSMLFLMFSFHYLYFLFFFSFSFPLRFIFAIYKLCCVQMRFSYFIRTIHVNKPLWKGMPFTTQLPHIFHSIL